MIVNVEGRRMVLHVTDDSDMKPSNDGPHTAYAVKRFDVHKDLSAFRRLISGLEADFVCELFGGSGWHTAAIRDLVKPSSHWVLDIDSDCVRSIRDSLRDEPGMKVFKANSYEFAADKLATAEFDWVHADFNKFTLMRGLREKRYSKTLDGIFGSKHRKVVTITDSAIYGFKFGKNLEAYEKAFGARELDENSYYYMASDFYFMRYGFHIREVITWDHMSSMYKLTRGTKTEIKITRQLQPANIRVEEP